MFDYEKFENLGGLELGLYFMEEEHQVGLDDAFVKYVRQRSALMDGQHLELALLLLARVATRDADHTIADYLDYPITHIRMAAIRTVTHLPHTRIDKYIISRARSAIEGSIERFGVDELREFLERNSDIAL
jgi:hypothetical protein